MDIQTVTTWPQLKALAVLAEEYSREEKRYDAPFAIYAVELARLWQLQNYEFVLFSISGQPAGYAIMHTDATLMNDALFISDIYVTKPARGADVFKTIIKHIQDTAAKLGLPRGEFNSKVPAVIWRRMTGQNVTEKTTIVVHREK